MGFGGCQISRQPARTKTTQTSNRPTERNPPHVALIRPKTVRTGLFPEGRLQNNAPNKPKTTNRCRTAHHPLPPPLQSRQPNPITNNGPTRPPTNRTVRHRRHHNSRPTSLHTLHQPASLDRHPRPTRQHGHHLLHAPHNPIHAKQTRHRGDTAQQPHNRRRDKPPLDIPPRVQHPRSARNLPPTLHLHHAPPPNLPRFNQPHTDKPTSHHSRPHHHRHILRNSRNLRLGLHQHTMGPAPVRQTTATTQTLPGRPSTRHRSHRQPLPHTSNLLLRRDRTSNIRITSPLPRSNGLRNTLSPRPPRRNNVLPPTSQPTPPNANNKRTRRTKSASPAQPTHPAR